MNLKSLANIAVIIFTILYTKKTNLLNSIDKSLSLQNEFTDDIPKLFRRQGPSVATFTTSPAGTTTTAVVLTTVSTTTFQSVTSTTAISSSSSATTTAPTTTTTSRTIDNKASSDAAKNTKTSSSDTTSLTTLPAPFLTSSLPVASPLLLSNSSTSDSIISVPAIIGLSVAVGIIMFLLMSFWLLRRYHSKDMNKKGQIVQPFRTSGNGSDIAILKHNSGNKQEITESGAVSYYGQMQPVMAYPGYEQNYQDYYNEESAMYGKRNVYPEIITDHGKPCNPSFISSIPPTEDTSQAAWTAPAADYYGHYSAYNPENYKT